MRRITFALALILAPLAFAQRLPTNVIPEHYTLRFEPDLEHDSFRGDETIRVDLRQRVRSITMNAVTLDLHDVRVNGVAARVVAEPKNEMVRLELDEPVGPGAATIHIAFDGTLRQQLRGFYLSTSPRRKYAVTQFEATDARRAFACFDEPAMKATFDITVVAPKGDVAISNMPVVSDQELADGRHEVHFATTPRLSTYLVAMLIGDFQCTSGSADGVPIRVCSTPENAALTQWAVKSAEDEVRYYDSYYRIHYPFPKLDNIGIPDFQAGAMENAGAIVYRETSLLAGSQAAASRRRQIASTVGHEIAHQWFGDLVTMNWWNDVWLNEGFATFMTPKAMAAAHPEWDTATSTARSTRESIELDSMRSTRAIRTNATRSDEINELFDGIAYGKTAAVLRMVEHWVGEEPFRNGISAYLKKYSWSNATGEDFWTTMAQTTKRPVDRVMTSFVMQAGAPVIMATQSCANDERTVELSQERFLIVGDKLPAQTWEVPVCARTTSSSEERCVVLEKTSQRVTFHGCSAPLLLNARGHGFYVTQYASDDLAALRAHLDQLSAAERVTLLEDDWMLVRARRRDIGDDLALVEALPGNATRTEMQSLADRFRDVNDYLLTDADRDAWRKWVGTSTRRFLPRGGWTAPNDESDEQRELRATVLEILGDGADDPDVVAGAREIASRYLDDPKSLDATLAEAAIGVAVRHGDAALFDRVLAAWRNAKTPEQRSRWSAALLRFRDPALTQRMLEFATGSEVKSQDSPRFLRSLLENPSTSGATWEWIRTRWDEVSKRFPYWALESAVAGLGTSCDAGTQREIDAFFATHPAPGAERRIRITKERVETCVAFRAAQRDALQRFLARK
jgi:aminopeptidase N